MDNREEQVWFNHQSKVYLFIFKSEKTGDLVGYPETVTHHYIHLGSDFISWHREIKPWEDEIYIKRIL
jgi:hypothetical protein